ncbi:MAG: hypothetical protein ACLP50_13335, partial [Solirubrobacteraceae bacterium]
MLDQLRQQIQTYLDELLGEADKLRRALVALGSRDGAATPSASAVPPAAPERARRTPASGTPARPRPSASTGPLLLPLHRRRPNRPPARRPPVQPALRRARPRVRP